MIRLSVKDDFSEYPGLRHCKTSDKSGEEFYHSILNSAFSRAFDSGEELSVNLDGTDGYASSFLDEAFGNLVFDFTLSEVKKILIIVSVEEPHWKNMLENKTFIEWEQRRIKGAHPLVTEVHNKWMRLVDGRLSSDVWEQPSLDLDEK